MKDLATIGFPAPLLDERNHRIQVLYAQDGIFALNKINHVLIDAHPWYTQVSNLTKALQAQLDKDKPELRAYQIERALSVYTLEPEITGVALFGINKEATTNLRNLYGSNNIEFTFEFLALKNNNIDDSFECDLPIAIHKNKKAVLVSHNTGKKASTIFTKIEDIGTSFTLWEAKTSYYRLHQLRLHIVESGLRIPGENLYDNSSLLYLSSFKKKHFKKFADEKPLYDSFAIHLKSLKLYTENPIIIEAPRPSKLETLLKKLALI